MTLEPNPGHLEIAAFAVGTSPLLVKGRFEIRRHFQSHRHFGRDQRYRLDTPGWRVLGLTGEPLGAEELELRRRDIESYPLVKLGNEFPFPEDLIEGEGGTTDPKLPILAKVSSLISALQLGGPV